MVEKDWDLKFNLTDNFMKESIKMENSNLL